MSEAFGGELSPGEGAETFGSSHTLMFVSAEGMKMRGMKNESNGAARAARVVSEAAQASRRVT